MIQYNCKNSLGEVKVKSVVFTKSFFEKLKEKASNSSQFTIGYKYNTQSKELLSFFLETEDLVLSVYENNLNNSINSIKIVKENGKFKEIQQKKLKMLSLIIIPYL